MALTPQDLGFGAGPIAPRRPQQNLFGDVVDAVQAGAENTVASAAEGVRQLTGFGATPRDYFQRMAARNISNLSPGSQEALNSFGTGVAFDPGYHPYVVPGATPRGLALAVAQGLGSSVPFFLGGGMLARGAKALLPAATPNFVAPALGYGATNALVQGGAAAQQADTEVRSLPADQLGPNPNQTYQDVAHKAFWPAFAGGAATGAVLGPTLEHLVTGGAGNVVGNVARGIGTEMAEEGVEGATQQLAVNQALQPYDHRPLTKDVATQSLSGAVLGGITGGITGGATALMKKGYLAATGKDEVPRALVGGQQAAAADTHQDVPEEKPNTPPPNPPVSAPTTSHLAAAHQEAAATGKPVDLLKKAPVDKAVEGPAAQSLIKKSPTPLESPAIETTNQVDTSAAHVAALTPTQEPVNVVQKANPLPAVPATDVPAHQGAEQTAQPAGPGTDVLAERPERSEPVPAETGSGRLPEENVTPVAATPVAAPTEVSNAPDPIESPRDTTWLDNNHLQGLLHIYNRTRQEIGRTTDSIGKIENGKDPDSQASKTRLAQLAQERDDAHAQLDEMLEQHPKLPEEAAKLNKPGKANRANSLMKPPARGRRDVNADVIQRIDAMSDAERQNFAARQARKAASLKDYDPELADIIQSEANYAAQPRKQNEVGSQSVDGALGALGHPELEGVTINHDHHVPYVAGTSKDRKTVYIDQSVPDQIQVGDKLVDPRPFIAIHELAERQAMDQGMKYDAAHENVANKAEKEAVERAGLDWGEYQAVWKEIDPKIEHQPYTGLPADLDLHPYESDHHDLEKAAQAEGDMRHEAPEDPAAPADYEGYVPEEPKQAGPAKYPIKVGKSLLKQQDQSAPDEVIAESEERRPVESDDLDYAKAPPQEDEAGGVRRDQTSSVWLHNRRNGKTFYKGEAPTENDGAFSLSSATGQPGDGAARNLVELAHFGETLGKKSRADMMKKGPKRSVDLDPFRKDSDRIFVVKDGEKVHDYKIVQHTNEAGERVWVAVPVDKSATAAYESNRYPELVDLGGGKLGIRVTTQPESPDGSADQLSDDEIWARVQAAWRKRVPVKEVPGKQSPREAFGFRFPDGSDKRMDLVELTKLGAALRHHERDPERDSTMNARDDLVTALGTILDKFGIRPVGDNLPDDAIIAKLGAGKTVTWGQAMNLSSEIAKASTWRNASTDKNDTQFQGYDPNNAGNNVDERVKAVGDAEKLLKATGFPSGREDKPLKAKGVKNPQTQAEAAKHGADRTAAMVKGRYIEPFDRYERLDIKNKADQSGFSTIPPDELDNRERSAEPYYGAAESDFAKNPEGLSAEIARLEEIGTPEAKSQIKEYEKLLRAVPEPETMDRGAFGNAPRDTVDGAEPEEQPPATKPHAQPNINPNPVYITKGSTISRHLVNLANAIVKNVLGLKTRVDLADEAGMKGLYSELQEAGKALRDKLAQAKDTKEENALQNRVQELREALKTLKDAAKRGESAFIALDHFANKADRRHVIYLPSKSKNQVKELLHEIGHYIQRSILDQHLEKSEGFRRDLLKNLFGVDKDFKDLSEREWYIAQERFAGQVYKWALSKTEPRGAIEKFYRTIGQTLERLWDTVVSKITGKKPYRHFNAFMDALMGRQQGVYPTTPLGKQYAELLSGTTFDSAPARRDAPNAQNFIGLNKLAWVARWEKLKQKGRDTASFLSGFNRVWSAVNSQMRQGPITEALAKQFNLRPGEKAPAGGVFRYNLRNASTPWHNELKDMFEQFEGAHQKDKTWMQRLGKAMILYTSGDTSQLTTFPELNRIKGFLDRMYGELSSRKMEMPQRERYMPLAIDKEKWSANKAAVADIIASVIAADQGISKDAAMDQAEALWQKIALSDGVLFSPGAEGSENNTTWDAIFGPGFRFKKKRSMTDKMRRALVDYYVQDPAALLNLYVHSGFKRAVFAEMFGDTSPYTKKFDPAYKINRPLIEAHRSGEISKQEWDRWINVYLPAEMGTLGQTGMTPSWRAFQSWTMLGLNMSLLPLSVLSNLVEIGQIDVRAGKYGFKDIMTGRNLVGIRKALGLLTHSNQRKELERLAYSIGTISHDLFEHVLGNSSEPVYNLSNTSKISNWYFRKIGMKWFSDFTRISALAVARDALKEYKDNPAKYKAALEELGVTPKQIQAWVDDNESPNLKDHAAVLTALNRWVDGATLRPNASIRPAWGSDPRFALVWHLKDFLWSFHETILRRVMHQAKDRHHVMKALPWIMMGAAMLPLAFVGSEIRKKITEDLPSAALGYHVDARPKTDGEYVEDLLQRSGMLGPLGLLLDMQEGAQHGSFFLLSAAGPTLDKFQQFLLHDMSPLYMMTHTLPGLAQSRVLREYVENEINGLLSDD